jgi:pyruvate dehydrogenase E2 component (dihydrolipoamide acetyltransferase)
MPLITMPKLSDTMSEGTIARWKKKKGDTIEMGDILADIETDKATMEMEAFDEGVLTEIYVPDAGVAKVGEKIALILAEGESAGAPADDKAKADLTTKAAPAGISAKELNTPGAAAPGLSQATHSGARIKASPLAKKVAAERGVSLQGVTGSGTGGRITAKDVPAAGSAAPAATAAPVGPKIEATPASEGDTKISLSNMRKIIAERLLASKTQIPHFYLSVEVDAAALTRVRKELNSANEAGSLPKLTINDFILLAVSRAAHANPAVNAAWAGDSIIQYAGVNLSVAVSVDDGLLTPVLRDAQKLNLKQISASVKDLATRARSKKLKPEEFQGGTITVSNLGAYGVDQFYAIVNPPQAIIIAVGSIVKKPVVNAAGEIVVGERMTLALSGDHRVVDGAVGATFLASLRRLIENPALMLF